MSSLTHTIGGIFQPLLKAVADVLAWLYSIIPIYPIDVALLTIIIMAILTPLTVKSTKNMAAMQALGPEMKKLQQKYKGAENRALLNEEMMKLYKEHKVNPASGCLPMLLQMPAFLVLYDVIRGITNTVNAGVLLANGQKCVPLAGSKVCADPRYISSTTKMYHDIVAASGQLNSFGLNFADKLLSHHSSLFAAIPYLLLVVGSVGLQYLQMSRLNARNPQAAKANPQAAMMQKYMPLIFGLIYLNVAALLNVYFIVSSSIRIGTQEVLFRKGIVAGPPPKTTVPAKGPAGNKSDRTEREIPKARPPSSAKAPNKSGTPRAGTSKSGSGQKATPKSSTVRARDVTGGNGKSTATNGAKPPTKPGTGQNGSSKSTGSNSQRSGGAKNATSTNGAKGNSGTDTPAANKENPSSGQPSSKAKRERKAQ
jgi:YidC/Oxa1 family membrane protein insertase